MKEDYREKNEAAESELSKRMFHLKTLCEVSHVLLEQGNIDSILRNFLLMTLGSFGVMEGFAFISEDKALIPKKLVAVGIDEETQTLIEKGCQKLLAAYDYTPSMERVDEKQRVALFPGSIAYVSVFNIAYACNGILGIGTKIVGTPYDDDDLELLETLLINLATTLKNVRSTQALKSAFREVNSLNRAKSKVINHLSHELKTPISLMKTALFLLRRSLSNIPEKQWIRTYERAERSLTRLSSIQRGVEDIMQNREFPQHRILSALFQECTDVLAALTAEQAGQGNVAEKIQKRIDELYRPEEQVSESLNLGQQLKETLQRVAMEDGHRKLDLRTQVETAKQVTLPKRVLSAIVFGLIKNAIENTPDEGRIDILAKDTEKGVVLNVNDFGTGIVAKHCKYIFEGFYPTQDTDAYSTKKPFDFNAGGKGTDLMRMKIFSEHYHFSIDMTSSRCSHIPTSTDTCPGKISACEFCQTPEDCHASGQTTFTVLFPSDGQD